jgi:hypothetical protein
MRHKIRTLLLTLIVVGVLAVVALLTFTATKPAPLPPLPNPNGYTDLVKAAQMLALVPDDYRTASAEELRGFISTNAAALQLARTGLGRECRVPLDYSATSTNHLDELSLLKRLAIAFAAEGRLAEMDNRCADAAKSYLDIIHLATESARGGVMIDQMLGTAIEAIGTSQLQKLVSQLDAPACRETAATLETLDAQRQSWDLVLQQEKEWSLRAFPGLRNRIFAPITAKMTKPVEQRTGQKFKAQQTRTRQLLIGLAARSYELEKGRRPASLADLVPGYLKAIPQDSVTGTNIVFTP